ncbi:hypothetical protein OJAV_G00235530 [Oryzias javanicus]|uniref:RNase H type-1 domain-containing protein n=1 Tax=Oryzias javanicus TaxID=123683 RepID=A0A3S2NNK0_ORYJA|nr:hypothetical protein OJAV_G00235530 [Oryzias javanicus]
MTHGLIYASNGGKMDAIFTVYVLITQSAAEHGHVSLKQENDSASRDPHTGHCRAAYAVCSSQETVESAPLPCHFSAQAAELEALTRACHLAAGKSATIYTDSRYAFGVDHDFGALWRHRGFLKSDGKPILHHNLVSDLLEALLLPSQVAVCKCVAHTNSSDPISIGNGRADAAAKNAALLPPPSAPSSLSALQSLVTPVDIRSWKQADATHTPESWMGPNGKPCLPSAFLPHFVKLTHGLDHVSKGG